MNPAQQLLSEYSDPAKTLYPKDFTLLLKETIPNAPSLLRNKNLALLDRAMSKDITVRFGDSRLQIPIRAIDNILYARKDSPTFGTVREIYARNCYLNRLALTPPLRAVLDLGANRGMFSLLALVHLGAEVVVGVEPTEDYDATFQLLLAANSCETRRAPRYLKLIGSESSERACPDRFVSIPTIMREQKIEHFDLVKMDVEGGERDLFTEPDWLRNVDNLTMELHPQIVPDLPLIPKTLEKYGFDYTLTDRHDKLCRIDSASFLVASRSRSS